MQVIIPMTGSGTRFKNAGYERLKPFIEVHNKPIIEWVVHMFKGDEQNILFVCREQHIENFSYLKKELTQIVKNANIYVVKETEWTKNGPVPNVLQALHLIDMNKPVLVSYCDYFMHWNYQQFKNDLELRNCDGAVPCYSGFHPHLIPQKNLYASCKVDEQENLIEIKEKFSFEADKTKARHSPGMYYFKSGNILKTCCQEMIEANDNINGEFYMSLPFNYLVKEGCKVWCPVNISHFCQWGTPEDLQEYEFWTSQIGQGKL